jgi:coenzyme Q-binding protein COQ10
MHSSHRFSPEQVYSVVADVKRYREFVPWCVSSELISEKGNRLEATLEVGFGSLRERYTSTVILEPFSKITSDSPQTAFIEHLITSWTFTAVRFFPIEFVFLTFANHCIFFCFNI